MRVMKVAVNKKKRHHFAHSRVHYEMKRKPFTRDLLNDLRKKIFERRYLTQQCDLREKKADELELVFNSIDCIFKTCNQLFV